MAGDLCFVHLLLQLSVTLGEKREKAAAADATIDRAAAVKKKKKKKSDEPLVRYKSGER